jgi:hypothetical protein
MWSIGRANVTSERIAFKIVQHVTFNASNIWLQLDETLRRPSETTPENAKSAQRTFLWQNCFCGAQARALLNQKALCRLVSEEH